MTVQNPPVFIQAGSHPAEDVRRFIGATYANRPGTIGGNQMTPAQNGTPNMSVIVGQGQAVILGTEATYQGMYFVENRGPASVSIAAADATNPRRDLIVARIRDAQYSGAANTFAIEAVTGTPAAVPVDPATPANSLVIARVTVAALAATITNANITDLRVLASPSGATVVCTSTTRPSVLIGTMIYEADTSRTLQWNGTGWTLPWNQPWGKMAYATKTATQGVTTPMVDVTDLSVTWTATSARLYRVSARMLGRSDVAGDRLIVFITNAANGAVQQDYHENDVAGEAQGISLDTLVTGLSGATTWKVRAERTGTGTFIIDCGPSYPAYLLVEDIGPA